MDAVTWFIIAMVILVVGYGFIAFFMPHTTTIKKGGTTITYTKHGLD